MQQSSVWQFGPCCMYQTSHTYCEFWMWHMRESWILLLVPGAGYSHEYMHPWARSRAVLCSAAPSGNTHFLLLAPALLIYLQTTQKYIIRAIKSLKLHLTPKTIVECITTCHSSYVWLSALVILYYMHNIVANTEHCCYSCLKWNMLVIPCELRWNHTQCIWILIFISL